jgi:hypothetical protein
LLIRMCFVLMKKFSKSSQGRKALFKILEAAKKVPGKAPPTSAVDSFSTLLSTTVEVQG